MKKLLAIITCWNRPEFLRQTLTSLFTHFTEVPTEVIAVDNGSDHETRQVLRQESRLAAFHLLPTNQGINASIELALSQHLTNEHRWVLISDADMQYRQSPVDVLRLLDAHGSVGAVSFQHSPEHAVRETMTWGGRRWPLKQTERGCALLFRSETLQRLRPLPVNNLKDFDWWACRDAPSSLQHMHESIAVFVGAARHLGWREGDSTWQPSEIPEYAEFRAAERQFVWGLRYIDDLIERDHSSERLYVMQDANWNVTALTNTSGTVQERYTYSAYGLPTFLTAAFVVRSTSSFAWETYYAGYRRKVATEFYHVRNRGYNALLGSWIQRDPLGYGAGINLYEYCRSGPLRYIDPFGLDCESDCEDTKSRHRLACLANFIILAAGIVLLFGNCLSRVSIACGPLCLIPNPACTACLAAGYAACAAFAIIASIHLTVGLARCFDDADNEFVRCIFGCQHPQPDMMAC